MLDARGNLDELRGVEARGDKGALHLVLHARAYV